jgi:hypothetical protein
MTVAGTRLVSLSGLGSTTAKAHLVACPGAAGSTATALMVSRSGLGSTTAALHLLEDVGAPPAAEGGILFPWLRRRRRMRR